ncbi:hypothetical protein C2E31_11345 [Rhodopirellula baltica]|nr:hypothetical protein C2E31_11345 [Rhodopirellula baltica]
MRWSLKTMLALAATVAWLCGAVVLANRLDSLRPSGGEWVTAAAVIVTIYYWRFHIATSSTTRVVKVIAFVAMLLGLLPYLYLYSGLLADWSRMPVSRWVGDPVWVYAIPACSFMAFDLRKDPRRLNAYLLGSIAEVVVIVPVWTYAWIIVQQRLGWWWM